jgi:hypothetical protein
VHGALCHVPSEVLQYAYGITYFQTSLRVLQRTSDSFWTDLGLLATIGVLLAVIGTLAAFNFFKKDNLVDFKVNYNTDELVNGQHVRFTVEYKNTSEEKISDAQAQIRLPNGLFEAKINDPLFDVESGSIKIGDLEPEKSGSFEIEGQLLADIGSKERFIFVLNYLNSLGQPQQEFTSKEFSVEKSLISLVLTVPQKIVAGAEFTGYLNIENKSEFAFDGLELKALSPNGFVISQNILTNGTIEAGKLLEGPVTFTALNNATGKNALTLALVHKTRGDKVHQLSRVSQEIELVKNPILIEFTNLEKNKAVKPGEQTTLNFQITAKDVISPSVVYILLNGEFVDTEFLKNNGHEMINGRVELGRQEGDWQANEKHVFSLTVKAKDSIQINDKNQGAQDIIAKVGLSYLNDKFSSEIISVLSAPLTIPVTSKIEIRASGLFYTKTGDQIGVGSVPPKVNEYTAYWAIIKLSSGVNNLRNVRLLADIPAGAEFTEVYNVTDGSPVRLLAGQNKLEWYIGELPAHTGVLTSAPEARIQIAALPEAGDLGKVLPLLTNIHIIGVDDRVGEEITGAGADITTAIFKEDSRNRVAD